MSDIQPEITPLPDGTYSVETAMGTAIFQSAGLPSEAAGPQKLSDARLAEIAECLAAIRQKTPHSDTLSACYKIHVEDLLSHADAQAKELADLRTRLHQEQQDAADQAAQLLVLHEESRKLRAMIEALELVRAGHMAKQQEVIKLLMTFPEYDEAQALLEQYPSKLPKDESVAASLPVQGEPVEGKEGRNNG